MRWNTRMRLPTSRPRPTTIRIHRPVPRRISTDLIKENYWSDGRLDYAAMNHMVEGLQITGQIKGDVDWTEIRRYLLPAARSARIAMSTAAAVSEPSHVCARAEWCVTTTGRPRYYALGPIDLVIGRGEFFSVVGPSGCGKSTLLDVLCGLARPTSGSVRFEGKRTATARFRTASASYSRKTPACPG